MDLCGVRDVEAQIIRTLSKGFRQRVGLADALLGDPDVLILDEPTIGLDPNQIRQTRETIRNLSERHTILLSTHILQEVEAICKRVLIIDNGRIVADDTVENLSAKVMQKVRAEIKGDAGQVRAALLKLEGVAEVRTEPAGGWNLFTITPREGKDVREAVFRLAVSSNWVMRELTVSRVTLEDVFHKLTVQDETGGEDKV
jgi:ABC-2 type transport system ATP-binding protein